MVRKLFRNLALVIALLSAANIVALADGSATVSFMSQASLNGVQLKPGQYKVSWQTHSPEATVTIQRGRKTLVTTKGRLELRDTTYRNNSVLYRANPDGSRIIKEIRFRGKNQVLVFDH